MTFRLLCVGLPSLMALIVATIHRSPWHLRAYFVAQIANLALGLAYGHVSGETWTLCYMVGTAFIFGATAEILWDSGLRSISLFLGSLALTVATVLMVTARVTNFTMGNSIILGEGAVLTFAAFALGFRSMYLERKIVYVTLVVLWLSLAFFDFSYALNYPAADRLQYWLPAALIGAAMAVIGVSLGREREEHHVAV